MKKVGFIFWMWVLVVPALAQVPGITYQAVIYDGQVLPGEDNRAAPLGDKDLCLKFVFKNSSGISEYEEVITTRTDAFGMVNVIIGLGRRTGGTATTFSEIEWNAQAKFLEVSFDKSVSCSTFLLISSQQFTSVPFALYAANSGSQGSAGPAGPQGLTGATGPIGPTGSTGSGAYQVAVAAGFVGTEVQWLASLQGVAGAPGPQGIQGAAGLNGTNGTNGVSAHQQWLNLGNTGTEADFLTAMRGPQGTAGATGPQGAQGVDGTTGPQGPNGVAGALGPQGPQGLSGATGINGQNGSNAYQVALSTGFVGTESQWLSFLTGAQGPAGPTGPVAPAGP